MPSPTPELGLLKGVDADDTADYLVTSLANSLTTVDAQFSSTSGHTHSGAHQGGPIPLSTASLLTNGGFEIWQRGNGPFTGPFAYCADRWQVLASAGTTSVTANAGGHDIGSKYSALITTTSPSTGALGNGVYQVIDAGEFAGIQGRTVTLSARVACSQASSARLTLSPDKAGGASPVNSAYHSGGGAWETLSVSLAVGAAAPGLTIWITGQVAGTWYIDNVMLVVGSQPADYAPLHPADDLARCLRYYEPGLSAPLTISSYADATARVFYFNHLFKAFKPVTPTVTKVGTWGATGFAQPTVAGSSREGAVLQSTTNSGVLIIATMSPTTPGITIESNP